MKFLSALLCCLALCSSAMAGERAVAGKPQRRVVGIYANHGGVAVTLSVNGVELYSYDKARPHTMGAAVNQWVRTGENGFSVRLSSPAEVLAGLSPYCEVIIKYAGVKGPSAVIKEWRWPEDGVEARLPSGSDFNFKVDEPGLGGYVWESSAPVSSPDGAALAAMRAAVTSYHALFTSGEPDKMLSATEALNREIALAYGQSEKENNLKAKARFQKLRGTKWLPLDADKLSFFPQAGGRLFRVTAPGGAMPIASVPDAIGFQEGYQMYLALVGGKWVWVR